MQNLMSRKRSHSFIFLSQFGCFLMESPNNANRKRQILSMIYNLEHPRYVAVPSRAKLFTTFSTS